MKRQRLKTKQESLQKEWNVRHEKLTQLRQSLVIQADISMKFQLEKQIQNEECEIYKLEEKLDEVEKSLDSLNYQPSPQAEYLDRLPNVKMHTQDISEYKHQRPAWDYRNLRDLLYAGKWKEANKETWEVMLVATDRQRQGWIDSDSFKKFPCTDLLIIDRLWINASEGQFGFSVQMKIWKECGCPMQNNDDWRKFLDRIGWCHEGEYNPHPKFNLDISPLGELPLSIDVASYQKWDASGQRRWDGISFFQRLLNCGKF
jgi:GUN4-like